MVAPAWAIPSGPKMLIGVLHTGICTIEWARSFASLQRPAPPDMMRYAYSSHRPYDVSRNMIAEAALALNVEWLLFLDSDVIARRDDAILRLMSHNLPIVSGVYRTKIPPHHPLVLRRVPQVQPDGTTKQVIASMTDWTPGELLQVDAVPTGLLLIHRRVLEKFKAEGLLPFEWTMGRRTRIRDELQVTDAEIAAVEALVTKTPPEDPAYVPLRRVMEKTKLEPEPEGLSEDFEFSVRAKNFGFPLHVDTQVIADHVTEARIAGPDTGAPGQLVWLETP